MNRLHITLVLLTSLLVMPAWAQLDDIKNTMQENNLSGNPSMKTGTSLDQPNQGSLVEEDAPQSKKKKVKPCYIMVYSTHSADVIINAYSANRDTPYKKAKHHTYTSLVKTNQQVALELPCTGDYTLEALPRINKGFAFGRKQCLTNALPLSKPGSSASVVYPGWFHVNCSRPALLGD